MSIALRWPYDDVNGGEGARSCSLRRDALRGCRTGCCTVSWASSSEESIRCSFTETPRCTSFVLSMRVCAVSTSIRSSAAGAVGDNAAQLRSSWSGSNSCSGSACIGAEVHPSPSSGGTMGAGARCATWPSGDNAALKNAFVSQSVRNSVRARSASQSSRDASCRSGGSTMRGTRLASPSRIIWTRSKRLRAFSSVSKLGEVPTGASRKLSHIAWKRSIVSRVSWNAARKRFSIWSRRFGGACTGLGVGYQVGPLPY